VFKKFLRNSFGFKLSSLWLAAIVSVAIFRDLLPAPQWDLPSEDAIGVGLFSPGHFFGTTQDGYDVMSGVLNGARLSVTVAVASVVLGGGIGTLLGVASAYYRGVFDRFTNIVFGVLLSIPNLVLSTALITVLAADSADGMPASNTRKVGVMVLSLTIVIIPILGRIARSSTLQWTNREFVLASKSMGTKNLEIIRRHILPNIAPAVLAIGFFAVGVVMIVEGSLSIIGIGIPGGASWGSMIAAGRNNLEFSPWEVFIPGACIAFTVLSVNYLGDYVRSQLDKRESKI
jgi:peptide/nickel transport system permease protein